MGERSVELERKIKIAFAVVEEWTNVNKLKMNAGKTKFMIVKSVRKEFKGNITLKCLDGTVIELCRNNEVLRHNY